MLIRLMQFSDSLMQNNAGTVARNAAVKIVSMIMSPGPTVYTHYLYRPALCANFLMRFHSSFSHTSLFK